MRYQSIAELDYAQRMGRRSSEGFLMLEEFKTRQRLRWITGLSALQLLTTLTIAFIPGHHTRPYGYGLAMGGLETIGSLFTVWGKVPESAIVFTILAAIHTCINLDVLLDFEMLSRSPSTIAQWILVCCQELVLLPGAVWFNMQWFFYKHKYEDLSNELSETSTHTAASSWCSTIFEPESALEERTSLLEKEKTKEIDPIIVETVANSKDTSAHRFVSISQAVSPPPTSNSMVA